jgi:uncharacterized membrane protein YbhN (UPF0104 family)
MLQSSSPLARFRRLSLTHQALIQNLIVWLVVAALLSRVVGDLTRDGVNAAIKHSDLGLFIGANVAALMVRWLADTYLFSLLFSYFHKRTSYREVLPASTAQYFLQVVNVLISDAALVVFLHRRKGVAWLTAGWTLAYQGFVDAIIMSMVTVAAGSLVPESRIRIALPYAMVALGFLLAVAGWWMRGRSVTRIGRWLRGRPGMRAFRLARPRHYLTLGGVRMAIVMANAMFFYAELRAFGLKLPLKAVMAWSPAMIFAQNAPLTPSGLGTLQIVMVWGLSKYVPRGPIIAAALGVSIVQLICRIPLGIGAAGTFARSVLSIREARGSVDKML